MTTKPRIFLYTIPLAFASDVAGMAVSEDGHLLAQHISSSVDWAKRDLGYIDSKTKHCYYQEHYPDGYELEWVDDPQSHEGLTKAAERLIGSQ